MRGMKLDARSVVLLLPLLLTACAHKSHQPPAQPALAPPIEDTPPAQPSNAPANLPPPVITVPQRAQAKPAAPSPTTTAKQTTPAKPASHHKHAAKSAQAKTPENTEQASNGTPEVSAIGQLSSGDPADMREETSASIADTERRLDAIKRTLSTQEQKTSAQIREFLKQAKAALATGDIDGAHTLALKAKVLLDELSQ